MTSRKLRVVREGVRAVVFDWAGTTVDYRCMAPVEVFTGVLAACRGEARGVEDCLAAGPTGERAPTSPLSAAARAPQGP